MHVRVWCLWKAKENGMSTAGEVEVTWLLMERLYSVTHECMTWFLKLVKYLESLSTKVLVEELLWSLSVYHFLFQWRIAKHELGYDSKQTDFFFLQIAHLLAELKTIRSHSESQKRLAYMHFYLALVIERSISFDSVRNSSKQLNTKFQNGETVTVLQYLKADCEKNLRISKRVGWEVD